MHRPPSAQIPQSVTALFMLVVHAQVTSTHARSDRWWRGDADWRLTTVTLADHDADHVEPSGPPTALVTKFDISGRWSPGPGNAGHRMPLPNSHLKQAGHREPMTAVRPLGRCRYKVLGAHPTCFATSTADMSPDAIIAFAALILDSSRAAGRPPRRHGMQRQRDQCGCARQ
jgi:hypothetical protein